MGSELNTFRSLLEGPKKVATLELVDSLVKEGMDQTYHKLMYIKDRFRQEPTQYDHSGMNLKIIYNEKFERDNKLRI